jgi:hypothetical protein
MVPFAYVGAVIFADSGEHWHGIPHDHTRVPVAVLYPQTPPYPVLPFGS